MLPPSIHPRAPLLCLLGTAALATASCGAGGRAHTPTSTGGLPPALVAQARPIGRGPRFHPAVRGPVLGRCTNGLGPRSGVHVELFAANRVALVAAGIGARPPLGYVEGRISRASCFGSLVTLEPTGVVLMRAGSRFTVGDLFRSWGQPLSAGRLLSFTGRVRVYVGGRRQFVAPAAVPLTPHAEIVLEVGPYVPPHAAYRFPPGA